jgi:hypothetical protein
MIFNPLGPCICEKCDHFPSVNSCNFVIRGFTFVGFLLLAKLITQKLPFTKTFGNCFTCSKIIFARLGAYDVRNKFYEINTFGMWSVMYIQLLSSKCVSLWVMQFVTWAISNVQFFFHESTTVKSVHKI